MAAIASNECRVKWFLFHASVSFPRSVGAAAQVVAEAAEAVAKVAVENDVGAMTAVIVLHFFWCDNVPCWYILTMSTICCCVTRNITEQRASAGALPIIIGENRKIRRPWESFTSSLGPTTCRPSRP